MCTNPPHFGCCVYTCKVLRRTHHPRSASSLLRGLRPSQATVLPPEAAQANRCNQVGKNVLMLKMLIDTYSRLISSPALLLLVVELNVGHDSGPSFPLSTPTARFPFTPGLQGRSYKHFLRDVPACPVSHTGSTQTGLRAERKASSCVLCAVPSYCPLKP